MLCIKLSCWLICFSTSPFLTLPFPWRAHLGCYVSTETKDLKPDMSLHAQEGRPVKTRRSSRDPSFVVLFPSGSKVTELTLSCTRQPPPPPHQPSPPLPHSSDRLQMQNAQSNLIVTINKTLYTSPISSSISVSP